MIEFTGKEKVQVYPNIVVKSPLVSVLVQTYNHENYIKECLDGILMQEVEFEYEILLSEDDSNDNTRHICIEYADKYPNRIRLFLHDRSNNIKINGKPTGRYCFIWNLNCANGKYIALCEGDDYWIDKKKLATQTSFLENNSDFSMCFTNIKIKHRDVVEVRNLDKYKGESVFSKEQMPIYSHNGTRVFRNQKLPLIIKNILGFDTYMLIWFSNKGKIKLIDKASSVYRQHESGMYSSLSRIERLHSQIITFTACMELSNKTTILNLIKYGFNLFVKYSKFRTKTSYYKLLGNYFKSINFFKIESSISFKIKILIVFFILLIPNFTGQNFNFRMKRKILFFLELSKNR